MGHLRTYKQTYESFFKNVLYPNLCDGWEIDIFIHTWDELEKSGFAWHNSLESLNGKKVTTDIIEEVRSIYKPKEFLIEHLEQDRGMHLSCAKSQELAQNYAQKHAIAYHYTLVTRPDLYFHTPLRLDAYVRYHQDTEELKDTLLPQRHIFTAHNLFGRMPIHDPRYICEADLLWFGNFNPLPFCVDSENLKELVVVIDYKLHRDFYLQRTDFRLKWTDPNECKIASAEAIVKRYLAYKLGTVALSCESWRDYARVLFVFSYIKEKHFLEAKQYNDSDTILQECKDYALACELKSSLAYKLGEKIIQIHKQKGALGLIFFVFFKMRHFKKNFLTLH